MKSPEDFHHEHPDVFRRFRASIDRTRDVTRFLDSTDLLVRTRSLLSIGPGEGDLEVELATGLDRLGAIDPDGRALEVLRARMRDAGFEERLGICIAETFQAAVQMGVDERFDLVLAVHSWYAIAYDRDALEHALALRTPGGALAIALASGEGMATELKALGPRAATDATAEEISTWARELGFAHRFELRHDPKAASLFIVDDALTGVGRALVGFLVSTPWDELASDVRAEGLRIVLAHVRAGDIDSATGWMLFD